MVTVYYLHFVFPGQLSGIRKHADRKERADKINEFGMLNGMSTGLYVCLFSFLVSFLSPCLRSYLGSGVGWVWSIINDIFSDIPPVMNG